MIHNKRRYRTGSFIILAELYFIGPNDSKHAINLNDLLPSTKGKRLKAYEIVFDLHRVKVTGEKRFGDGRYGYRGQFYSGKQPIDCFCCNRFKSFISTGLLGDDYMWIPEEKTIILVDVNYLFIFIDNNVAFEGLRKRICSSLQEGTILG